MTGIDGSVFISYARLDEDLARALKDRLGEANVPCQMDTTTIVSGDDWHAKIVESIKACVLIVVVCTRKSLASHEVTFEWAYAAGQGVPVVPVVYEKDLELPTALRGLDRLDFADPGLRQWDRLVARIQDARSVRRLSLGTLRLLGVENIVFGRRQLAPLMPISRIIERAVESSQLVVVGRSLEAWSREFEAIESAVRRKGLRVRAAVVDPALDPSEWFIPTDYAAADLSASISKFKLISVPDKPGMGSFELYYLPNSPLCSLVFFEDSDGLCGILELGASLSFEHRFGLYLRASKDAERMPLLSVFESFSQILACRSPAFRVGSAF